MLGKSPLLALALWQQKASSPRKNVIGWKWKERERERERERINVRTPKRK